MPRNRIDLTQLDRRIKSEFSENSFPSRSHPIQTTSYSDEREYSRVSRHTRRDSRSRDRYYSRNDSYDRNISRDYSHRSRRSPYRGRRSRSRSRGRTFRDHFTRYKDHCSPDYRRSHRSPEYRRSNRYPEYQRDNYFNNQENLPPHPVIKQEDQTDSNYVQFLTRQIFDLTCQIQAMQAERSGSTQVITPISTDYGGAEIRDTTNRQQINVPTPIEISPRPSELNLPSSHPNESERVSPKPCTDENLRPMDPIFKHVFRDEVVSILDKLPTSHQFKITQYFSQQIDHITYFTVPAIKEKISPTLLFTDDELVAVLKQLHKSRRGFWKNEQREVKYKKRKHISSRTARKMRRRINGLKHMIYVNDPVLRNSQPPRISWNEYLRDLESAVNDSALQSAEESDTDEELANDERENDERPANIYNTNSVIKVVNKPWRSARIACLLHRCDEVTGSKLYRKRWQNENYIDYNSRPKDDVPSWWISTKWSSSNVESGENEAGRSDNRNNNYINGVEIVEID